jgi:hemolysin activation/secretion protein
MKKIKLSLISLSSLCMVTNLIAAPDAGTIQRDIEQKMEQKQLKQEITAPKLVEDDGQKILVKSFQFNGNTVVSSKELQSIVAQYENRELTFKQLQTIVAQISDYYTTAGSLAKIFLPKQDLTNGQLIITIIEGKLSKVIIDNNEAVMSKEKAEKYIYSNNDIDAPIKSKNMSESLMNLNAVGGLGAKSSIAPGEAEGSSDLVVKLKDAAKFQGDIGVDNYGSRSTGKNELLGGFIVNNLTNSDLYDNLNVRGMHTQGVDYGRVAYTIPLGYNGDKIGVSYSAMGYDLIEKYSPTIGDGSSHTTAIKYDHPFIKTKEENLNLSLELARKYGENSVDNETTSIKRTDVANLVLAYDKADSFLGGGSTNTSIGLTFGNLDLKDNLDNYTNDKSTAQTNGNYKKYNFNITRIQALSETLTLQAAYQYQAANKNLDGAEELSLGGVYGVRAYPTSEASGDEGWITNIELKWAATNELTPSIFYDYGRVTTNAKQWDDQENIKNKLDGYGVGLNWASDKNLNIKTQVSRRISDSYVSDATTGMNSDGTNPADTRYWLSATWFF